MARVERKAKNGEIKNQSDLSLALPHSICLRCGGLMVDEISMDLMNVGSELECATKRCVQCGDILDRLILRNRRIRQEPMTV
ncbi:MAG: hypothetical protein AB7L09_23175 [Nitrospira sp.]